jgi:hypothetical protein
MIGVADVLMDTDLPKKLYGAEYPAAIHINGARIPLSLETAFTRHYISRDRNAGGCEVSRFMDGSASMVVEQLRNEWPGWTKSQRLDFCQSCVWLHNQADFGDMLRFIMARGGSEEWSSAFSGMVAMYLPKDEAFPFLVHALQVQGKGICSNLIQAIATTKHPDARRILCRHLQAIWDNPVLWNTDDFLNWAAADAILCIQCLIELGASPTDFEKYARKLSQHVCPRNRASCREQLSAYYLWLKQEN